MRSHSSTFGRTSRSAKARTVFRSCSRSGVCQTFILSSALRARRSSSETPPGCPCTTRQDVDGPAAQPLAQPLGLWVEPCLICDALSEDAVDDEVDGPQIRQQMTS